MSPDAASRSGVVGHRRPCILLFRSRPPSLRLDPRQRRERPRRNVVRPARTISRASACGGHAARPVGGLLGHAARNLDRFACGSRDGRQGQGQAEGGRHCCASERSVEAGCAADRGGRGLGAKDAEELRDVESNQEGGSGIGQGEHDGGSRTSLLASMTRAYSPLPPQESPIVSSDESDTDLPPADGMDVDGARPAKRRQRSRPMLSAINVPRQALACPATAPVAAREAMRSFAGGMLAHAGFEGAFGFVLVEFRCSQLSSHRRQRRWSRRTRPRRWRIPRQSCADTTVLL